MIARVKKKFSLDAKIPLGYLIESEHNQSSFWDIKTSPYRNTYYISAGPMYTFFYTVDTRTISHYLGFFIGFDYLLDVNKKVSIHTNLRFGTSPVSIINGTSSWNLASSLGSITARLGMSWKKTKKKEAPPR